MQWNIKKNWSGYYVTNGAGFYLDKHGNINKNVEYFSSTVGPHEAIENYERNQQMTTAAPQVVDWSQPIQTDEKPPRKARLICEDRKSSDTDRTRIVLIEIGKDEWVYYCDENGHTNTDFCIVNVPAKVPYGREDWERLSRVRKNNNKETSYPVGLIGSTDVVINGYGYPFKEAATIFVTMDGKELYK